MFIQSNFLPALYVALSDEHIRHGSSWLLRHSSTGRGDADSVSNVKLIHPIFALTQSRLLNVDVDIKKID